MSCITHLHHLAPSSTTLTTANPWYPHTTTYYYEYSYYHYRHHHLFKDLAAPPSPPSPSLPSSLSPSSSFLSSSLSSYLPYLGDPTSHPTHTRTHTHTHAHTLPVRLSITTRPSFLLLRRSSPQRFAPCPDKSYEPPSCCRPRSCTPPDTPAPIPSSIISRSVASPLDRRRNAPIYPQLDAVRHRQSRKHSTIPCRLAHLT